MTCRQLPSILSGPTRTAFSRGQLVREDIYQERLLNLGRAIRSSAEDRRFAGGFLDLFLHSRDSDLYVVSHYPKGGTASSTAQMM